MEACSANLPIFWERGRSSHRLSGAANLKSRFFFCPCIKSSSKQARRVRIAVSTAFWQGEQNAKEESSGDFQNQREEAFGVEEHTFDINTPQGTLSPPAVHAIEQFSRLNGSTGQRMKEQFERSAPVSVQNDARNFLEFCCFRYFAKGSPEFLPVLKDAAFRRLTFILMLGWQQPYEENINSSQLQMNKLVAEPAFVRIAPSIPGAADRATAHHLFNALTAESDGLPFEVWDKYLSELCDVLKGRESFRRDCTLELDPDECTICFGASRRQPVQKWDKGVAWPGNLTMTDRALYFEPFQIFLQKGEIKRLSFNSINANIERKKVGPLGLELFDSAISVSSGDDSESWVLEFVDFSGKGRREYWYFYIREMITAYNFIREFAPKTSDHSLHHSFGAKNGRKRAVNSALLGIARFQALQATLKTPPQYPERLLQFCYLANAPGGFLVLQTLAVDIWGGRMELNNYENSQTSEAALNGYVVGTEGGIYYRKWMDSESWQTPESITFWKQKLAVRGLVLGKNHVVGGVSHLERGVEEFRKLNREIELTKATIDGAIIAGIPENIDLFKELLFPFQKLGAELMELRGWKQPIKTIVFLICFYAALYKNLLRYVLPSALLLGSISVLVFRGLKASGNVEPDTGKVTIKEQPPSNTIQKIISLKEALAQAEKFLQDVNVVLLKLRTIALSSNPKATNLAVLCSIAAGVFLLLVPFRVTVGLLVLDQFTMELEFRKPMVRQFLARVNSWWESIPAAPVVVDPYEKPEANSPSPDNSVIKADVLMETLNQWFGDKQQSAQE